MSAVDTMTPNGLIGTGGFSVTRTDKRPAQVLALGSLSAYTYYLRAWDTGTVGYVYWGPYSDPATNLTPSPSQTTPNYTGSLQNPHVWLKR